MSVAQELRFAYPQLYDESPGLEKRQFQDKLYAESKQKCAEFLKANNLSGKNETNCTFEIYSAYDCIRREKVQKSGRFNDPLRLCKYPISFMKYNLKRVYGEEVSLALLDQDMMKVKKERLPFV